MSTASTSLDDRRPRSLREVVGNAPVVRRLSEQMRRGSVPNRVFLFGPSGSGKTTLARILVRHFFCRNRVGTGDVCGRCPNCLGDLNLWNYEQWTAARLESNWGWWESNASTILTQPGWAFFLDEVQDLSEHHQKAFYDQLESARALVIFATTHKHAIKDAVVNRFGANVYEMHRPGLDEVVAHMRALADKLRVAAPPELLGLAARHYGNDLRKCVDFVYTAADQAPGGAVTPDFVAAVLGVDPRAAGSPTDRHEGLVKV